MASASVDGVAGMMRELMPEDGFDDQRVAPQIRVEGDAIGGLRIATATEGRHGLIAVENDGPGDRKITGPAVKKGLFN